MKPPEPTDPAKELMARLWRARAAYEERHFKLPSQARIASEVSRRAGVTVDQTTVGTWFKGTPPKPWFFRALADYFEVGLVWLLSGVGEMRTETEPPAKREKSRR